MTLAELRHIAATRRLKPGDRVCVRGMGEFTVIDNTDSALITVRSPHGATLRLGRLVVQIKHVQGDGQEKSGANDEQNRRA